MVQNPRGRYDRPGKVPSLKPERHINETSQHRNFHQWPDNSGEGRARVNAEDRNGNCNRQLEIITCSSERKGRRPGVVRAHLASKKKAHEEHDAEVNKEGDSYTKDIQRKTHKQITLKAEHHDDSKEKCDERYRADHRNKDRVIPRFPFGPDQYKASQHPGNEGDPKINKNAFGDLPNGYMYNATLKAE